MKYYEDYRKAAFDAAEKSGVNINVSAENSLSFTPYIENKCSAACRFCSERLIKNGQDSLCGAMCEDYEQKLSEVLSVLNGRNVFLSLSGKEPTESPELLYSILCAVKRAKKNGLMVSDAVMYSNFSGFCKYRSRLTDILTAFPLTRIELSRHHFDEEINQSIMNFRPGEKIKANDILAGTVRNIRKIFPMRMVCVLQRSGVGDIAGVERYLDFADSMGINDVVFRELAVFGDSVDAGNTADYIIENRVEIWDIIHDLPEGFRLVSITQGYYYFSFVYTYNRMRVCFEMSDYEEMEKRHTGSRIHKLIFYPDGKLCRSWNKKGEVKKQSGEII